MAQNFLTLAQTGKNQWWRYLLGILIILASWQVIGLIPFITLLIFLQNDQSPETKLNSQTHQFQGVDPLLPYLAINFSFVCFLIGLYIVIRFIHQRKFITLITAKNQVSWRRIFQGFGVWVVILAFSSVIGFCLMSPDDYKLTFNLINFFIFLPVALIFTPIQASVEELFFRGYLMQFIGLKTRSITIPILITSLLFMFFHLLNPEVKIDFFLLAFYYFLLAAFLAFITVKDNSLELAIGVHVGHNLFGLLLASYSNSVLPSPSIFTIQTLKPAANLISFSVYCIVFYFLFFRKKICKTILK